MSTAKALVVIEAFKTAATPSDFSRAVRTARRLTPPSQLLVVDHLRAAEARLNLGRKAR